MANNLRMGIGLSYATPLPGHAWRACSTAMTHTSECVFVCPIVANVQANNAIRVC